MSDTPRTDAETGDGQGKAGRVFVKAEFARSLERELAHAALDPLKTDTPNKEQLALRGVSPYGAESILDVINALRAVVVALKPRMGTPRILSRQDARLLLNLLADAEAKLQLP